VKAWIQARPNWIEVRKADTSLFTPTRKIHDGEREAIALAIELQADAFLCDDGNAIKEALRLNIPTVRLFTILESAAEQNLLDLPEAILKMKATTFHTPPDAIINAMLKRDQQRKEAEEEARKKTQKRKPRNSRKT
jgi:predicted nucleic acid-binding protein